MTQRKDLSFFVQESNIIHCNKYDYSQVVYKNCHKKVTIICPKHGPFQQKPNTHTSGRNGCMKCKIENMYMTTEEFKNKATKVHNNTYNYDNVQYVSNIKKVLITCKTHGDFLQSPNQHISAKQGCPKCHVPAGKYNNYIFSINPTLKSAPAWVYLIQIELNNNTYNKVGLTKRSICKRYAGFKYETVVEYKTTVYNAWLIEQQMLKEFHQYRLQDAIQFCGWSEIILIDTEILQHRLNIIIKEQKKLLNQEESL